MVVGISSSMLSAPHFPRPSAHPAPDLQPHRPKSRRHLRTDALSTADPRTCATSSSELRMSPSPEGAFDTPEPSFEILDTASPKTIGVSNLGPSTPSTRRSPVPALDSASSRMKSTASARRSFRARSSEEPQSLPPRRASTPNSTEPLASRAPKDSRLLRSFDRTSGVSNPAGPSPHSSEDPRGFRPRTFDPSSPLSGTGSLKSGRT